VRAAGCNCCVCFAWFADKYEHCCAFAAGALWSMSFACADDAATKYAECVMCLDYDGDVADDCVMSPLTDSQLPVFVTAFYASRDLGVACSNGSTAEVHVVSLSHGDDVTGRLPRIRVNIVSGASSTTNVSEEGLFCSSVVADMYKLTSSVLLTSIIAVVNRCLLTVVD